MSTKSYSSRTSDTALRSLSSRLSAGTKLDLGAGEIEVGRRHEEVADSRRLDAVLDGGIGQEDVVHRDAQLADVDAETSRGVALRVEVDDQGAVAHVGEAGAEVDGGGRLPHAALLVGERHDPRQRPGRGPTAADRVEHVERALDVPWAAQDRGHGGQLALSPGGAEVVDCAMGGSSPYPSSTAPSFPLASVAGQASANAVDPGNIALRRTLNGRSSARRGPEDHHTKRRDIPRNLHQSATALARRSGRWTAIRPG